MTTAVRPIRQGIDGALLNDAGVGALVADRMYADSSKPENAELPFISYGTPYEGDFGVFNHAGNDGSRLLHLYGVDDDQVEQLYAEVKRALYAGITVTGHNLLRLTCSLLSVSQDVSGDRVTSHGVVRVAALTYSTD